MDFDVHLNRLIAQYDMYPLFNYKGSAEEIEQTGSVYQYHLWQLRALYEMLVSGREDFDAIGIKNPPKRENLTIVLQELIYKYLEGRNFVHALLLCNHYVINELPGYAMIRSFMDSLVGLLDDMKGVLQERKHDDVFLVVIDSLCNKYVNKEQMPFLAERGERGFRFNRAYSTSIYTQPGIAGILTGQMLYGDNDLKNHAFGVKIEDSPLLKYLSGAGYELYNLSGFQLIADKAANYPVFLTKTHVGQFVSFYKMHERVKHTTPRLLWRQCVEMANNLDKPIFAVTLLEEFHTPCVGEWHSRPPYMFSRKLQYQEHQEVDAEHLAAQRDETLKFIDGQLGFYYQFFSERMKWIFTADHGQLMGEHGHFGPGLTWHTENCHVPLILTGTKGQHDGLFSHRDSSETLRGYIETGRVAPPTREFAEVQRDPIYDKKFLDKIFIGSLGKRYSRGFKMIVGENDKYVKTDAGEEEYCLLADEDTNVINDYPERVSKLREVVG